MKKLKILLADDQRMFAESLKTFLNNYAADMDVLPIAANGKEACELVDKNQPDIILMDVRMPEMDGLELTRTIKQDPNYNHLPIILLTAKTQTEDEKEALLDGADEYLRKPFRLGDLKLRIDNIIENRKRMQTEFSQMNDDDEEEKQTTVKAPTPDEIFLKQVRELVYKHIDDESYDRDALAADMGASASTLYNKLRSISGMHVSAFIRDTRMKEAKRMAIENPNLRVSDLAYRVGFHDPRYFATCFKKQFGTQPKEFLESLQQAAQGK